MERGDGGAFVMRAGLVFVWLAAAMVAQVTPLPQTSQLQDGCSPPCRGAQTRHAQFAESVRAFDRALQRLGVGKAHSLVDGASVVEFCHDEALAGEAYRLTVDGEQVVAAAGSVAGIAHAAATLLLTAGVQDGAAVWAAMAIDDRPDLPYRSFMVDMGRNPHSPQTLRAVVDMMWLCKANYLHLHLTDDQLFSWPSTRFPKLYSKRAGWTRDDFVELERYSQARGVTIIPEVDVPGHSTILRREYPEVFGKTPTELATSDAARQGVEALLDEMLDVFVATPYVHVGGDEAYGVDQDVQRDFLNRLNAFVRSRGRRTVVWEGPHLGAGEHKVDENVLHINWRTIDFPAQQMLDAGYEVVAAPWDPMYIVDHYPRTMFTAVDVQRCYEWDLRRFAHINHGMRTFGKPHRTNTSNGIVGFCMPWWEGREPNLLPLCLPRLFAVAAAAWNREGEQDFADFQQRLARATRVFERVSGVELAGMPFADPESQRDNLAYRAKVTPSRGASQPHFGPQRLTNGIPDRFDHFLGFPTQPDPLEIVIELAKPAKVSRVVVYERAVNGSHEVYELFASGDGVRFESVGKSGKGTRGDADHVEHRFATRDVRFLKIVTHGCHGLTFPSFSRLCEVMAFVD